MEKLMNNESSELLYIAYKSLVLTNIKSGFLGQHISEADYYALDKFPKLLFEVLDTYYDRYATGDFLRDFYAYNPHRDNDIEFSKEVFGRLRNHKDFKVLLDRIGEDAFIDDVPLLVKAFEKVDGGSLITSHGFTKLKTHQKLMEALYDSDKFSLVYFDLPPPTDDELVKNILAKDPRSYSKLNDEQKNNKEYAIIALENGVKKSFHWVEEYIYNHIPEELRKDRDIALIASLGNCQKQPKEAFLHEGVVTNLLNGIHKEQLYDKDNSPKLRSIDINKIENIPVDAFEIPRNIKELFDWIQEKQKILNYNHENYCSIYRTIKSIAKISPYVKEQISKKDTEWIKGNIGETKYERESFFKDYFYQSVEKVCQELKHYVMAYELNQSLDKKTTTAKKMKI
jgi:hypothetical protein